MSQRPEKKSQVDKARQGEPQVGREGEEPLRAGVGGAGKGGRGPDRLTTGFEASGFGSGGSGSQPRWAQMLGDSGSVGAGPGPGHRVEPACVPGDSAAGGPREGSEGRDVAPSELRVPGWWKDRTQGRWAEKEEEGKPGWQPLGWSWLD